MPVEAYRGALVHETRRRLEIVEHIAESRRGIHGGVHHCDAAAGVRERKRPEFFQIGFRKPATRPFHDFRRVRIEIGQVEIL